MNALEIHPGRGIGPFVLGMPISRVIALIQTKRHDIDTAVVKYCKKDMLKNDIVVDLLDQGMLLRIEPISQRLKSVAVYRLDRLELRYRGKAFSGASASPTFGAIHEIFGPTEPGEFCEDTNVYTLTYAGLSFEFSIPDKWTHLYVHTENVTVTFPDGSKPCATRLTTFDGTNGSDVLPYALSSDPYFERVNVDLGRCSMTFEARGHTVVLGMSTQDVVNNLGWPDRVFAKDDRDHFKEESRIPDYFYNYFSLGVDILFDGLRHLAKKFVLHTNFPSCADFNVYTKCNFALSPPPVIGRDKVDDFGLAKALSTVISEAGHPAAEGSAIPIRDDYLEPEGGSATALSERRTHEALFEGPITPDMMWEDIRDMFIDLPGEPLRHISDKEDGIGPTMFFGYDHVIFEVMANGHLATVCIF